MIGESINMRNLFWSIVLYLMISETAFGVEVRGDAKHTIPPKLRYIFPLLLRKMEKASIVDIIAMICWHVYLYSWIIVMLIHRNLGSYYDEFMTILYILLFIYAPFSLKGYLRYKKWIKINPSIKEEFEDTFLFGSIDIEAEKGRQYEYTIEQNIGAKIFCYFAVLFSVLVCIVYSSSEDYFISFSLWGIIALFIWAWCDVVRWRITVKGEQIIYRPTIGKTRICEINDIEYCKVRSNVIDMYGSNNKRLFTLFIGRKNASLLLNTLIEKGVCINRL